jgi:hypothetical protein
MKKPDLRIVEVVAPGFEIFHLHLPVLHRFLKQTDKSFFSKPKRPGNKYGSPSIHINFYDERRTFFDQTENSVSLAWAGVSLKLCVVGKVEYDPIELVDFDSAVVDQAAQMQDDQNSIGISLLELC